MMILESVKGVLVDYAAPRAVVSYGNGSNWSIDARRQFIASGTAGSAIA